MSVLGELMRRSGSHDDVDGPADIEVASVLGELAELIGAVKRNRHGGHRLHKPGWREGEMAPGVNLPDEGMHPLPLAPQGSTGLFANSANGAPPSIVYSGQIQVPFRGERIFAQAARVGTTAALTGAAQLLAQIFVGVGLQQADIFGVPIEVLGGATTFGSRFTMKEAPPGILIRMIVTEQALPTSPDFVQLYQITLMGRVLH
jgi:hypothetical protein